MLHGSGGLWMLALLGGLIVWSGLPVWALLIGVSSAFAAWGWAVGLLDLGILSALPARLMGLLEHDLLQALPLYVLVGVLLQRLALADAIHALLARLTRRTVAGDALAALGVGALLAPMNGSVASSSALLAPLVTHRLSHLTPARAVALSSVAATIGVVVPPSLVLLLLGDAMLRAHTEASNLAGRVLGASRIISTQDVFHAALLPAGALLALWALVAAWQGRRRVPEGDCTALPAGQAWVAGVTVLAILALLGGVYSGQLMAVEASASAGMLLVGVTLAQRRLSWGQWRQMLDETLSLSGALFALLVGASTFSLVFRLLGTDRWVADLILGTGGPAPLVAVGVLLLVAGCAWVLDAFEMVFVIVPIVAPALIVKLGDAQQAAVLLLLVLQMSFLVPPMGYAVLMARARSARRPGPGTTLLKALAPYVLVQGLVAAAVFLQPRWVHLLDAPAPAVVQSTPLSEQETADAFEEMARRAAETAPEPPR